MEKTEQAPAKESKKATEKVEEPKVEEKTEQAPTKESKKVVFQHATMTYFLMKLKVGEELKTIEWVGGVDRRANGGIEGAYYSTSDAAEIKALKKHPQYNKLFFVLDKVDLDKKNNSKVDQPKQVATNVVVAPEDVETVQDKAEFISENFGVPKAEVNTATKIENWLKANPRKVQFSG